MSESSFNFDELSLLLRLAGEREGVLSDEMTKSFTTLEEEQYNNLKNERHRLRLLSLKIQKKLDAVSP